RKDKEKFGDYWNVSLYQTSLTATELRFLLNKRLMTSDERTTSGASELGFLRQSHNKLLGFEFISNVPEKENNDIRNLD
ncbi:hypothetical protein H5410_041254, partial [Solanum commersonii]